MSFRFVSSGGDNTDVAAVSVFASGVVRPGMVVDFDHANGRVTPSSNSSTVTTIFGLCLDYAQGASDVQVRVLPFVGGQMFEADCVSPVATAQIGKKHQINSTGVLLLNTSYDQTGATGIFLVWNIETVASGSAKVLGEFIRLPSSPQNTALYF